MRPFLPVAVFSILFSSQQIVVASETPASSESATPAPPAASVSCTGDVIPLVLVSGNSNSEGAIRVNLDNKYDLRTNVSITQNDTVFGVPIGKTEKVSNAEFGGFNNGTLKLDQGGTELKEFKYRAWGNFATFGESFVKGIGLGPSSNFLSSLLSAKKVPTNSYSLTYSDLWASEGSPLPLESLILGGYDPLANSTTFSSSPLSPSDSSLLDVSISHITINLANGTQHKLTNFGAEDIKDPNSETGYSFPATLDNSLDYLILPERVIEFFKDKTLAKPLEYSSLQHPLRPRSSVNGGALYSTYLLHDKEFNGNLTIQLTNGFQATIPRKLLNRYLFDKAGSGILISSILGQPPRMNEGLKGKPKAVLGNVFLSQAVLHVDYDNSKFHLAAARHHADTVKPVITGCTPLVSSPLAADSTSSNPPAESSSKRTQVILGAVLGSILGVIAILVGILFFLKKRKRQQRLCSGGYNRYSETASTSRPSWIETEAARLEAVEKEAGLATGSMGSRAAGVSLAGSGALANTADRGSVGSTQFGDSVGSRHFAGFAATPGERGSGFSEAAAAAAAQGGIAGNMAGNGSGGFVGGNGSGGLSGGRGMTVRTDGVIPESGFTADGIRLPETPSRISVAPSRKSSIPAGRNSYFTEDLDDK